jgi:transposase
VILFSDEAGIKLEPTLGSVWSLKGQQPMVPTNSSWTRVNLTGFVDPIRGTIMVNTMPKGNSENFVKQLKLVLESNKDKKLITLYVDNARWHKTNLVKDWVLANPSIKIEYLPKYAPDVNPIERHWWFLRKATTQNVLFESFEECWDAIKYHFDNLNPEKVIRLCQI